MLHGVQIQPPTYNNKKEGHEMFARCDVVIEKSKKRCKNEAYREGYFHEGKKSWWSYLCRKHFYEMKGKDKRLWNWCRI